MGKKRQIIVGTCNGDGGEQRPTTSIADMPDEILELVLLRVPTPVCLFRAAATCKRWRRVVAGEGFLHRLRSLRGHSSRLLLGHYSVKSSSSAVMDLGTINAEFVPSPPRPASSGVHLRQRVSLDLLVRPGDLPHGERPVLTDSRGSLLAFVRVDLWCAVVCEPWTKQYSEVGFPWGEDEDEPLGAYDCVGAFLLGDAGAGGGHDDMSSFRLLCVCLVLDNTVTSVTAEARVFSAADNRWLRRSVSAELWDDRKHHVPGMDLHERLVGRTGGSIFWSAGYGRVLVLDESTLEFSTLKLPPAPAARTYYDSDNLRVVGSGGRGRGVVRIVRVVDDVLEALTATRLRGGGWRCIVVERRAGLCQLAGIEVKPEDWWSWLRFVETATTPGLVIGPAARSPSASTTETLLFSLYVQTMTLQPANKTTTLHAQWVFPYQLPWPHTIGACP
ncbi:hypothetical protein BS78_08G118600 [Paspalum vaginatum]|nr:hypothetical protein BS78_08G118600 [Paspalum vaginatum]